jgi:hypothetical protein
MVWATFGTIFSQTHLVTLDGSTRLRTTEIRVVSHRIRATRLGKFLKTTKVAIFLVTFSTVLMDLISTKRVGLHFEPFFRKLIWPRCATWTEADIFVALTYVFFSSLYFKSCWNLCPFIFDS